MAAATVTKTEYGFQVTGDTGAATVSTGKIWVKAMAFAGAATTNTAVLTNDVAGVDTSCFKFQCLDAGGGSLNAAGNFVYFGEIGVPFTNLTVTLNAGTSILYIFVR